MEGDSSPAVEASVEPWCRELGLPPAVAEELTKEDVREPRDLATVPEAEVDALLKDCGASLGARGRAIASLREATFRPPAPVATPGPATQSRPRVVVFGGGTACNALVSSFAAWHPRVSYIIAVTDNGGSTSEILRVLGGPAIGDIRSRLVRLSRCYLERPGVGSDERRIVHLLEHRLPSEVESAQAEWSKLLEGQHSLYTGLDGAYVQVIQSFLLTFHTEIMRRAVAVDCGLSTEVDGVVGEFGVEAHRRFDFRRASVGNCFFTGVRLHFGSLPAAILMWTRIARVPPETKVLPSVNANFMMTIGAELENGTRLIGQTNISHPPAPTGGTKDTGKLPLPSPVKRLFFVNRHGQQIQQKIPANEQVVAAVKSSDIIVYAMGSLWTSICPNLCLPDVAAAVLGQSVPKVLLLNGEADRETMSSGPNGVVSMNAADFVHAVCRACSLFEDTEIVWTDYVTDVVAASGSTLLTPAARQTLEDNGVRVRTVPSAPARPGWFDPVTAVQQIAALAGSPWTAGGRPRGDSSV